MYCDDNVRFEVNYIQKRKKKNRTKKNKNKKQSTKQKNENTEKKTPQKKKQQNSGCIIFAVFQMHGTQILGWVTLIARPTVLASHQPRPWRSVCCVFCMCVCFVCCLFVFFYGLCVQCKQQVIRQARKKKSKIKKKKKE